MADGDLRAALLRTREVDARRMTTSAGVHRDDVRFCVDGRELRLFGSQGQQRTAALSLRLAELDVVRSESGEAPVLLLDDVMSELDPERRRRLLAHLEGNTDHRHLHGRGRHRRGARRAWSCAWRARA